MNLYELLKSLEPVANSATANWQVETNVEIVKIDAENKKVTISVKEG